jgi:hypothetical protein
LPFGLFEGLTLINVCRQVRLGEKLPSRERQRWRKAAGWKHRAAVSRSKLLGGIPESRDEPGVGFPELAAHRGAHRMEERCGRPLRMLRTIMGMLTQDRGDAQRLASRSRPSGRHLSFDLMDQAEGPRSPELGWQVLPARKRREVQRLDRRVLETIECLPPVAGGVLLSAVEPVAGGILALDQRPGDLHSRPVLGTCDEALFTAVREKVLQSRDLRCFLVADHDGLVSPRPDLVGPAVEPADLAGEVGIDIAHEIRKLAGVVDVEQEVIVGGEELVAAATDFVEALGPSEDADDDLVELPAGPKEETAVDCAAGDLDQGTAVGDEAESSHARIRRKMGPESFGP